MRYSRIVVDGSYLVRRPFEANGIEACVGASIGVLLELAEQSPGARKFVVWEGPPGPRAARAAGSRQALDPRYKADRLPWDPELVALSTELREVYRWLGWAQAWCEDEADDAAAALVETEPSPILLWSADKDWLQLVRVGVDVQREFRGSLAGPVTLENIVERTGLTPAGWTAYLALAGDTSDKVAGVDGIGDKRARKILAACPGILLTLRAAHEEGRARLLEARLALLCQAGERDASIMRWVATVCDQVEDLLLAESLVTLRPESPLTVVDAALDLARAAEWCRARGSVGVGLKIENARLDPDPWDALPF